MHAADLIEKLAIALVNQNLYGPNHRIARDATLAAWEMLEQALKRQGAVEIGLTDEAFLLDGTPVPILRPTLRHLRKQLESFQTNELRFESDLRREDFHGLLRVLNGQVGDRGTSAGDLSACLVQAGVQHVVCARAVYRRADAASASAVEPPPAETEPTVGAAPGGRAAPSDDAEVAAFLESFRAPPPLPDDKDAASRDVTERAADDVPPVAPPPAAGPKTPPLPPETSTVQDRTESMAAFLDGANPPEAREALTAAASGQSRDISAMVSLLIAAIMMRKQREQLDGEAFVQLISQSLKRTCEAVQATGDDSRAAKAIRGMRQGIGDWLKPLAEAGDTEAAGALEAAEGISRETLEALEVRQTLAGYVNRRRQLDQWERKLANLIQKHPPDAQSGPLLMTALGDAGLKPNDWETAALPATLLGAEPATAASVPVLAEAEPQADAALNAMLATLHFSCQGGADGGDGTTGVPPDFDQDLKRIREEIDALISDTTQKIEKLAETIESLKPDDEADRTRPKSLVDLMAEAVQELMQPLSVINSAIDILGGPVGGKLNDAQRRDTLQMASENTLRLQKLIEKIGSVSGLPGDLGPHKDWLDLPVDQLRELV